MSEATTNPLDSTMLLLASGMTQAGVEDAMRDRLSIPSNKIAKMIAEARRRITLAADYHRDQEIGTAYTRLNDIYRRSLGQQDPKTALMAQKELNRLLDLYRMPTAPAATEADPKNADAAEARLHLAALGLGRDTDTLSELARLAVDRIVELEGNAN